MKEKIIHVSICIILIILVLGVGVKVMKDVGDKFEKVGKLCNESISEMVVYEDEELNCSSWMNIEYAI